MRWMVALVSFMGVLIVAGVCVVAFTIMSRIGVNAGTRLLRTWCSMSLLAPGWWGLPGLATGWQWL